jgi:hypothetical protein
MAVLLRWQKETKTGFFVCYKRGVGRDGIAKWQVILMMSSFAVLSCEDVGVQR